MRDVWTVMWKEWKELAFWDGGWLGIVSLLILVALLGVLLPWEIGPAWVTAPWILVVWAWMPLFLATSVTADSVAGERERHTLETLLATRLPSPAILLGKLTALVLWVWAATMLCVPVGLLTVNLRLPEAHGFLRPTAGALLGIAVVALLSGFLGASMGVLVSLGARTVRQAQQTLAVWVLGVFLLPVLLLKLMPKVWVAAVFRDLTAGDTAEMAFTVAAVMLAVDTILLMLALARFRRERLLLG
ncbi:MAG: ABC transporter permease subunit [Gemmatimonadota bacterium]